MRDSLNRLRALIEKPEFLLCALVVIASLIPLFYHLGNEPFKDYDEATYAMVTEDTLASGDLLTLKFGNDPWIDKPPVYFWSSIAVSKVFADPEFSYRFTAALSGVLSIILAMMITFRLTRNYYASAVSGVVLATLPAFIEAARQVRLDVPVTAAILFTAYSFLRARERPAWLMGMGVGTGLGFMLKSIIGVLSAPFVISWTLVHREFNWLKNPYTYIGVVVLGFIVLPWHLYESALFGHIFWDNYLFMNVIQRFDSHLLGGVGASSNFVLIVYLLQLSFPWSFAFIISTYLLSRERHNASIFKPALSLFLTVATILSIFLISKTKLAYYILPLYPFAAVFIAVTWFSLYETAVKQRKILIAGFVIATVLGVANTIFVAFNYSQVFYVNTLIAADEKELGLVLASKPASEKVYAYDYRYWETIRYYGNIRKIELMSEDQLLSEPFHLILTRPLFDTNPFPEELAKHFTIEYSGKTVVLLRFQP